MKSPFNRSRDLWETVAIIVAWSTMLALIYDLRFT